MGANDDDRRARTYDRPSYRQLSERVAENCRRLRAARQWTQVQASVRCELALQQLQRVEAGRFNITLTILARLSDGFGVDAATFFAPLVAPPSKRKRRARA